MFCVFNRAVTVSLCLSFSIKHRSCFVYSEWAARAALWNRWQRTVCPVSFQTCRLVHRREPFWCDSCHTYCGPLEAHCRPISSKEANVKPLPHILACITAAGSVCGHHRRGAPLNINELCSKKRQKRRHSKHKDRCAVWTNQSNQTSLVEEGECADEQ